MTERRNVPGLEPVWRLPPYVVEMTMAALSEVVDWSLSAYHVPEQWRNTRGEGVRVAVLDTGIDAEHPDLRDAIDDARDFTGSPWGPVDKVGHGTHVAGTIGARQNQVGVVGVAPECRLSIGKVLGDQGQGDPAAVAAGIRWASGRQSQVISLSLGSPEPSDVILQAIVEAGQKGAFVVCAAGNSGRPDSVNFPAAWPETIAVGAVDEQGRVAPFSSRGEQVDVGAPGTNILSTYMQGGYARLSGTSMATPFVSGVIALLLAEQVSAIAKVRPGNLDDLRGVLKRTARDVGAPGHDTEYGWGLISPEAMLAVEAPKSPPPPVARQPAVLDLGYVKIHAPALAGDDVGLKFSGTL